MAEYFENTYEALDEWGEKILRAMEAILLKNGKRATGDLVQSLDYDIIFTNPGDATLIIEFADHGIYVHDGRRPGRKIAGRPGYDNVPPVEAIMEWAKAKGLRLESTSDGWAIAVGIAKKGIKPVNFIKPYEKVINGEVIFENGKTGINVYGDMNQEFVNDISDAYLKDIEVNLEKIMKEL